MTKIVLTFEGSSWAEIEDHMRDALALGKLKVPGGASTALNDFPDNADLPEPEAVVPDDPDAVAPPTAAPRLRRGARTRKRIRRKRPRPRQPPNPRPNPCPSRRRARSPSRRAQERSHQSRARRAKNEGNKKVLDLLPGFKQKTGLDFIMSAENKHRVDLFDLIEAAGIELV